MRGAVFVAIAAAIGNFLQGWDNATIAGSVLYIKREFNLESQPTIEGLIVATSLIGATVITTFSGLLDGFGIGLAVTLVPVYISETAPPEIRGLLNTLPQFTGSAGMFLSYCMVFGMSLMDSPSWRLMLGILSIPSIIYFALAVFFLPESPRWLVSKGKMKEAKQVLQMLRGREDVAGEMALLVEGLDVGNETSLEEYIIGPDNDLDDDQEHAVEADRIKLYGAEEGQSWIAKPVTGGVSRYGSISSQSMSLMDPMVTLFGSVHERLPESGSMRSMLFPNFGSMFNVAENNVKNEQWDEESPKVEGGQESDASGDESDDNIRSPLISRQDTNGGEKENADDQVSGMGIGGGWQLAYRKDDKIPGGVKRIYLHQEGGTETRRGSLFSLTGGDGPAENEFIHAAALVSQSVLQPGDLSSQHQIMDAVDKRSESVPKRSVWKELLEPGVKHALFVGVGIQILQQFSGINGVLYYTPQILEQAGVGVLLSNLGLSSDSASFLISALTTLLMLPSIGVAMRLMDIAGRRWLLLSTLPVLLVSLIVLVLGNLIHFGSIVHAVISTVSVIVYFCCFVTGFGPVPNILCAEIFPTRVRGFCIAICALTFWIGDIIVTYTLPVMLNSIGLAGVFGIYAVVCIISWFFVFFKVPETKGMPLEVITEFFAVGAKQQAGSN
ncbi:monosaccharide-sensing protein 2-like [Dorcoceras hygrometricum]|uniref:Monosaccharide-sensing protein 2-like n=1 Tax=Dorcoceras hygrometricum TaxID=472368 RepID=A0A2Z7C4H5_9LAMI|nr:monosaccharide-sensing protein 2-like [Dorcoceras hygrometricum]